MAWKDVESAPHISASQIGMYLRCPKQYEFRYIKGLKRPPNLSLVVGSSVHKSIELNYETKFTKKKPIERDAALDAFSMTFEEMHKEADFDGEDPGKAKDRGYSWAEAHYDFVAPTLNPLTKPELEFRVDVPGVKRKLLGYVDIIGEPVSKIAAPKKAKTAKPKRIIFDNKTSKRRYDRLSVELSIQLTSYDFAHEQVFGARPDGVGFDVLTQDRGEPAVQRLVTTREPGELKRFVENVVSVEKGIDAGVFPSVDDAKVCSWCGYRDLCNKAATRRAEMAK